MNDYKTEEAALLSDIKQMRQELRSLGVQVVLDKRGYVDWQAQESREQYLLFLPDISPRQSPDNLLTQRATFLAYLMKKGLVTRDEVQTPPFTDPDLLVLNGAFSPGDLIRAESKTIQDKIAHISAHTPAQGAATSRSL